MIKRGFDPLKKKTARVLGAGMAYVEHGSGKPILLLHGNPTSSYLWRKVIPPLSAVGRCIAVDLIGMGDSAKLGLPEQYRFKTHADYLEAFIDVLDIGSDITLVAHDWGGPLAFDWARRHPGVVRGIAYMETIAAPVTWADWPEAARNIFHAMRSEAGEEIVLRKNVFVERILPSSVLDPLPEAVLNVYRRPYIEPGESRRPTLTWPREIPIDGEPADVAAIAEANAEFFAKSTIPKLFVNAEPGMILTGRPRELVRSWPNQTEVTVRGLHFIQEDSGEEIGEAIAGWLKTL